MTDLEKAIQYVRDNKTWSEAEEQVALDNISEMRCDLRIASPKIHYAIYDLMEEYWKDNELEGEWYEDVSNETDSIFFEL